MNRTGLRQIEILFIERKKDRKVEKRKFNYCCECQSPKKYIFREDMVVRFQELGVPDPKGWSRSHSRVYDYNTEAGSFYYQVNTNQKQNEYYDHWCC